MSLYNLLWWSDGIYCMHCKSRNFSFLEKKNLSIYSCLDCGGKFTVFTKTPFERTKLSEEQWEIILSELTPETRPFILAKKVGIHHWSMSKIMTKIKKHLRRNPPVSFDETVKPFREGMVKLSENFDLTGDYIKAFKVMLAFLYYAKDPETICRVAEVPVDFVKNCLDNVKKSWESGKEFFDCGKNYADYDNFDELTVVTHLYLLCMLGEIVRNPENGTFSCLPLPQGASPPISQ